MFTIESQNHSAVKIVNKLHEYYEIKANVKALRVELAQIAVDLGCMQSIALSEPAIFLDGYLAGAGILPAKQARREKERP